MVDALQDLFTFSIPSKPIDNDHLKILIYLLIYPKSTANNIHKSIGNIFQDYKPGYYRKILRRFEKLYKLNLVEKMPGFKSRENDVRESIPYKLSLHGIIYIILNRTKNLSGTKLIFYLLKNYPSNILFRHVIHPLLYRQILGKIENDRILSYVYIYIINICKELQNITGSDKRIICSADRYILKKIFDWPDDSEKPSKVIPFSDKNLIEYLMDRFHWFWIDKSRIEPNYKQNWIDIYKPNDLEKIIRLSINKKENQAILTINDKKIDEFIIKKNNLFLSINIKTNEKKEDLFLRDLLYRCKLYQRVFQVNIRHHGILIPPGSHFDTIYRLDSSID